MAGGRTSPTRPPPPGRRAPGGGPGERAGPAAAFFGPAALEVAGGGALEPAAGPRGQAAAHPVELRTCLHLLCPQRRLNALEEPLEPTEELGLGDSDLGFTRRRRDRCRERLELLLEILREPGLEHAERAIVDLAQPFAPGLVRSRAAHFLAQLAQH